MVKNSDNSIVGYIKTILSNLCPQLCVILVCATAGINSYCAAQTQANFPTAGRFDVTFRGNSGVFTATPPTVISPESLGFTGRAATSYTRTSLGTFSFENPSVHNPKLGLFKEPGLSGPTNRHLFEVRNNKSGAIDYTLCEGPGKCDQVNSHQLEDLKRQLTEQNKSEQAEGTVTPTPSAMSEKQHTKTQANQIKNNACKACENEGGTSGSCQACSASQEGAGVGGCTSCGNSGGGGSSGGGGGLLGGGGGGILGGGQGAGLLAGAAGALFANGGNKAQPTIALYPTLSTTFLTPQPTAAPTAAPTVAPTSAPVATEAPKSTPVGSSGNLTPIPQSTAASSGQWTKKSSDNGITGF